MNFLWILPLVPLDFVNKPLPNYVRFLCIGYVSNQFDNIAFPCYFFFAGFCRSVFQYAADGSVTVTESLTISSATQTTYGSDIILENVAAVQFH